MLKERVITSCCGLPLLAAAIWFDFPLPWFTIVAAVLAVLAFIEYSRLVKTSVARIYTVYGVIATILFVILRDIDLLGVIDKVINPDWTVLLLLIVLLIPLILGLIRNARSWKDGYWTIIGIVWTGWTLGHLVAMRGMADGRNWVFFTLFVIFAYDSSAFFTGRSLGRHKMAPTISPGKTWEGAVGGLIGAILVSLLFTLPTVFQVPVNWVHAVILGIIISVVGQTGDLLESRFKRYIRVKDSGNALPGHGGFLDRVDSIVFTGVIVYYYVIWLIQ